MIRLICIFFLLLSCKGVNEANDEGIQKIIIEKVDFSLMTTFTIKCSSFDQAFADESKKVVITEKGQLDRYSSLISKLTPDPEEYMPDVRAKLLLFYEHKVDTLCLSRLGATLNGKPMIVNDQLVELVKNAE